MAGILSKECGVSEFISEILVNRGMNTYLDAKGLLESTATLEDPFVLSGMQQAVDRIKLAVENYEKIAIYGDYDCDGVTSTVLLYSYLSMIGANCIYYIPKREGEGYGMNQNAVKSLQEQQVSLIITVDNGISALEEIRYAKELGMEVIVTDHHQAGQELPAAMAIVNPHQKGCLSSFKHLAGVGVAFKLAVAMEGGDYDALLEQFGDLVAIGTIGDVVPLVSENRALVQQGLELLKVTENIGLSALMEAAGVKPDKLTSQSVAFGIVPRINAAGRMKDAALAVQLLLSDDAEEAAALAQELNEYNVRRKELEQDVLDDIQKKIAKNPELLNDRVLTFYHEGWHHGVIGIACSRILETYGKPNLLMVQEEGMLRGSARSTAFFPLYKALAACADYLQQYGGHKQAAGFSMDLEKFPGFKLALEQYAADSHKIMPCFTYEIDKEIRPGELSLEQIRELEMLEPFGAENQQPLFLFRKAKITSIVPVSENKHVRLKLLFGDMPVTAMCFRISTEQFSYREGDMIDFLAQTGLNYYNGKEYLNITIKDIHPSAFDQDQFFNAKAYYEMFRRGEPLSQAVLAKMTPGREDTAVVYRHLKKSGGYEGDLDLLYLSLMGSRMNYGTFRLVLDILSDVNLIRVSPLLDGITLCTTTGKVDLESAQTMRKLKL